MVKRIINIANRLPVSVSGQRIHKSSGGLVSAMNPLREHHNMLWIGWPGSTPSTDVRRSEIAKRLLKEFDSLPVYLSAHEERDFYHGFCNSLLWPILHYNTCDVRQKEKWWDAYKAVNKRFCLAALEHLHDGDMIWIHDYHLMLLPQMLRQAAPHQQIGFFLHTPFPSYETFRCIARRDELLRGMMGADLIGFHTYGYLRHFRSAAMRLLGVDTEINLVRLEEHVCRMGVYPIGIDAQAFRSELNKPSFKKECERLKKSHSKKRIILSVERLDYSKGLIRRLEAIDRFLESYAEKENILFLFISVPSREKVPAYKELRENVEALVGHINGRHSTIHNTPIEFVHDSVKRTQLTALYATADVMLVTPLIDGMNLVAKEYLACRRDDTGVLILSEFAGAANELSTALTVNPYDVDGMARAIAQALEMPIEEQRRRVAPLRKHVVSNDAQRWAQRFIDDIAGNRMQHLKGRQKKSTAEELADRVRQAKNTIIFLDYDGTLRTFEAHPESAKPTDRINAVLSDLAGLDGVSVTIISGRSSNNMESWFGRLNVTLVAEHGASCRFPGTISWTPLVEGLDLSWKPHIMEIVQEFARSTPGSAVEDKGTAIVWHYRRCDPEFGFWKAQELLPMLADVASNLPVEVQPGNAIVEIRSLQVSKGHAVRHFTENQPYELIVCIGDDTTDESMFRIRDKRLYSIKIGNGPTSAMRRLSSPDALLDALEGLVLKLSSKAGGR